MHHVQARAHEVSIAPVVNQHVNTRSLIKRWSVPNPTNRWAIWVLDLLSNPVTGEEDGPKGVGKVKDLVPFASESMEDFWEQYENLFPELYRALDAGDPALFSDQRLLGILRDLVAVHYVRCLRTKQAHFRSFDEVLAAFRARWHGKAEAEFLLDAYERRTGDTRKDADALERALDLLYQESTDLVVSGQILRQRMEDLFTRVRGILDGFSIEIWTPKPGSGNFILGDAPVVTHDPRTGLLGIEAGVGILQFGAELFMPLGPDHVAWLHHGTGSGFHPVNRHNIDKINAMQVLLAHEVAITRPGGSLEAFADRVRKAGCFPPVSG
jgi:hypothetical protein